MASGTHSKRKVCYYYDGGCTHTLNICKINALLFRDVASAENLNLFEFFIEISCRRNLMLQNGVRYLNVSSLCFANEFSFLNKNFEIFALEVSIYTKS